MKKLSLIPMLTLLATMIFVVRCGSDDPAPLVKITGKVIYNNAAGQPSNAVGAVVYLAKSATATTNFDQSTIADANGSYSFSNLSAGTYFVNAKYDTDNKNVTARLNGLLFTGAGSIVVVENSDVTQDVTLVSSGQSGAGIETLAANYTWTGTTFANTGAWTFDASHSPVNFEFPYRGNEADFSGSFSQINKFVVNFDPANPTAGSIVAEVDLASVNTRTPGGRDNRTTVADNPLFSPLTDFTELGCIMGTFGITADNATPTDAVPQKITQNADRYAKFTSTSIATYGDGYIAKGNMIFHGITFPMSLWFKVVPSWLDTSNNRKYSGFEGKFLMNAKNDFAITSSSVNDAIIKIHISIVLYKQP
ncbi:MAG: YceI family protein [Cyclobacteriaceae bacterium]|nr:YceI family protein [Cyclobacteriaceae bacterium]